MYIHGNEGNYYLCIYIHTYIHTAVFGRVRRGKSAAFFLLLPVGQQEFTGEARSATLGSNLKTQNLGQVSRYKQAR